MNDLALMFSIFVACRRAELTLSVDAAAAHAGISAEAWRDIESGAVVPPHSSWVINELAHVLDVSSTQLSFIACVSEYNRSIQRAASNPSATASDASSTARICSLPRR